MDERETQIKHRYPRYPWGDARREVFLREDCSWMIAKSRSGNRHGYLHIALFHEEYFYAGPSSSHSEFSEGRGRTNSASQKRPT